VMAARNEKSLGRIHLLYVEYALVPLLLATDRADEREQFLPFLHVDNRLSVVIIGLATDQLGSCRQ
jgi:hypothetical protein